MKIIKFIPLVAILMAGILITSSCEKSDEDTPLSSAELSLLGEWDMEKAFKNGASVGTVSENPQIGEITEDWWFFKNHDVATEDGNETLVGSWQLLNDDQFIKISISQPSSKASTFTYEILQLEQLNMIWEQELNGDLYRYEFKLSSKETPNSADEI